MVTHPTREEFDTILERFLGQRLVGRPKQAPFFQTEVQNYKLGSRLQGLDGLVWHYCRNGPNALDADSVPERGMVSLIDKELYSPGDGASVGNGLEVQAVAGSYQVTILDANPLHIADYWANGKAEFWGTYPALAQHRVIKSSTPSDGTRVVLTLYYPLTVTLAAASGLEITRSQYALVESSTTATTPTLKSVVCVPLQLIPANYYFWGQTWGLCSIARTGDIGLVASQRMVSFHSNGTIHDYVDGEQPAGYIALDTVGGQETVIMLQLDP